MNIPQTPVNNAFDFNSTIKPQQILSSYLPICIYCNNKESVALLNDGSFRQCLRCRKHFKVQIISPQQQQHMSQPVSYQTPIFHSMRPMYMPSTTPKK
jgi:hypothetical protein